MRLSEEDRLIIKEAVASYDQQAEVYLFGSRVDDSKKGGDIDLLIFSGKLRQGDAGKIREDLWERMGEQQIDIIIAEDDSHPFVRIALKEGVLL